MTSTVESTSGHQNLLFLSQQSCWFENQKQQKKNTSFLHCFTWERLPCVLTLISLSFSLQSFVRTFPSLLLHVGNTILSKHSSKRWPAVRWYIWTTTSKLMERHVQETLISLSGQERKTKDILRKQKIGFCFLQKMWTLHNTQDYATTTIERYQKQTEAFLFFLFTNRNLHGQVLCTDRHSLLSLRSQRDCKFVALDHHSFRYRKQVFIDAVNLTRTWKFDVHKVGQNDVVQKSTQISENKFLL